MVEWITVLIVCQLAGEAFVAFTHVPIPGPVCGMALLFAGLVWNGRALIVNTLLTIAVRTCLVARLSRKPSQTFEERIGD